MKPDTNKSAIGSPDGLIGTSLTTTLRRIGNRILSAAKGVEEARAQSAGPTPRERQTQLIDFYEKYESLIEVIVDSAQFGANPGLEKEYKRLREYMHEHYPLLQGYLLAFLKLKVEDDAFGLTVAGQPSDAFQALTICENLDQLLRLDDGSMIDRITRTREALTYYGEHLRYLNTKAE